MISADALEVGSHPINMNIGQEFLSFVIGEEHYAIDIMAVREIRGYEPVTKVANAPDYIKGVLNLRGEMVPVVDLRIKFNVGEATYNEFTIVIVLNIRDRVIGVVVDAVSDVFSVAADDIKPPPEFGVAFDHAYLNGLVSVNEQMIIVVNIEALITSSELGLYEKSSAKDEL